MSAPPPSYECAIGLVEDDRDIPESRSSCSEVSGLLQRSKSTSSELSTETVVLEVAPSKKCKPSCCTVSLIITLVLFILYKKTPDVFMPLCINLVKLSISLLDSNETAEYDQQFGGDEYFVNNVTSFCDHFRSVNVTD